MMKNQAERHGVRILESKPPTGDVWKVKSVRCLSPEENGDMHNILVEALDEQGRKIRDGSIRVMQTWKGRDESEAAPSAVLNKIPSDRWGGDIPMFVGQELSVWINDGQGTLTDLVLGLRSDHGIGDIPPVEDGNRPGHRSFEIVFQRQTVQPPPPPSPPPSSPPFPGEPVIFDDNGQPVTSAMLLAAADKSDSNANLLQGVTDWLRAQATGYRIKAMELMKRGEAKG